MILRMIVGKNLKQMINIKNEHIYKARYEAFMGECASDGSLTFT